jgi:hypothetical protein
MGDIDAIDRTDLQHSKNTPSGEVAPTLILRKMLLENSA